MSTSRGYYECRRVYGAFKCRSGNLFLRQPGVEGFPTFPKWLLPRHYWGLKLKTGKKEGGRTVEPPKATPFLREAVFCCSGVARFHTAACSSHGRIKLPSSWPQTPQAT